MHWAKRGDSPINSQAKVSDNAFYLDRKVQGPPSPFFRLQEQEVLHQMRDSRLVVMAVITIASIVIG
ncbi:hypothetical protein N7513_000843 [Penicillium frequentans]|nr:hypothetical protein N7513_000843 [Penicillium glabrum]